MTKPTDEPTIDERGARRSSAEALAATVREGSDVADTDPVPEHVRPSRDALSARYDAGHEIARGGMGRVVEATDRVLGRTVAVKEALATDPDALRRFARETRITARLEHPSIVPVYDAGTAPDGSPFYVMRKVSGRPLDQLVDKAETLDQRLALLPHVVQAAQAVAHAHRRGIIHRDLKPANILVGDLGETIVIDWGLAKVIGESEPPSKAPDPAASGSLRTRIGAVFGTPGFMSPEQLQSSDVDERADVYALGATLYYVLARRPPHAAATSEAMMTAAVAGPPAPVRTLVPGVPGALATIVDTALAYDDKVRYRDAAALAEDLHRFLTGQLVASHHYSARERLARFVGRYRGVVIAVAAAMVALAIGAWLAVGRVIAARDDAMTQMHAAEAARERADERADELALSQARSLIATNPTRAVALARPLADGPHWRDVRAIVAGARAAGVAWRYPASPETVDLAIAPGGTLAASAGSDGAIRVYDLVQRTTRELPNAGGTARIAFVDDDHLAIAHEATLVLVDLTAGMRRSVTVAAAITALTAARGTVYLADRDGHAWKLAAGDAVPVAIAVADRITRLEVTDDGARLALGGAAHLWIADGTAAPVAVADGKVFAIAVAHDDAAIGALAGKHLVVVRPGARPVIADAGLQITLALARHTVYTAGLSGIEIDGVAPPDTRGEDAHIIGFAIARDGLVVTGKDAMLQVFDGAQRIAIPSPIAPLEAVVAAPRGHHALAVARGAILDWDLDDVMPHRYPLPASVLTAVVGNHEILIAPLSGPSNRIDLVTHESRPGPAIEVAGFDTSPSGATVIERCLDGRLLQLHLDTGAVEPIADGISVAVLLDDRRVIAGTQRGELEQIDLPSRRTTLLATRSKKLTRLEPGARFIVALSEDRVATRYDLVTRRETTLTVDSQAVITDAASDGTVWLGEGARLRRWAPDGSLVDHVTLPDKIATLVRIDDHRALAVAVDGSGYDVALDPPGRVTATLAITSPLARAAHGDLAVFTASAGGATVLDLTTGAAWTLGRELPRTATAQITPDGTAIYGLADDALLAWPLAVATSAAETARQADALTNADIDAASLALSWRGFASRSTQ